MKNNELNKYMDLYNLDFKSFQIEDKTDNEILYEEYFKEVQKKLENMTAEEFFRMFGMSIDELPEKKD